MARIDTDQELGRRIHLIMWERGITQHHVADQLGIGESSLSRSLRGGRHWRLREVVILSELLDVPIGTLVAGLDAS